MKEITLLLLDQMFSSTAIGPMEVFRHAGSLWNALTGAKVEPAFRVTTATADGGPVTCDGGIKIVPNVALKDVGKTDLIFVPTKPISSLESVVDRRLRKGRSRYISRAAVRYRGTLRVAGSFVVMQGRIVPLLALFNCSQCAGRLLPHAEDRPPD